MLWATGCSHTYGDDLQDKSSAWPYLLAKKLGMSCNNNAVSGGSNERVLYESVKFNTCELAVVAWTYKERFTRYDNLNNFQINFNPSLAHTEYSDLYYFNQYGKLHYAHWSNTLYEFKIWLQQIIVLQKYFESKSQRYLMLNAAQNNYNAFSSSWLEFNNNIKDLVCFDVMNDEELYQEHIEIQKYIDEINMKCYYSINNFHITDLHNVYPVGKTGHLLDEGHQHLANRLYDCLKLTH
jgi:hypothetical protein